MNVIVFPGKTYAITPTTECTVTTTDGITITTASPGEQTVFIAPTAEIEISDPSALITETFKSAPAGYAAAGSLSSKQTTAVQTLVENAITTTTQSTQSTPTGTDNALLKWYQIDASRIPAGTVTSISMPCLSSASTKITTTPIYLSILQLNDNGEYEHIATSQNAITQAIGQPSTWTFRNLRLTSRTTRFCPVPNTTTHWTESLVLGARLTSITGENSKIKPLHGSDSYLVDVTLTYTHQHPKYATATDLTNHTSNTTTHITADERTAWNAKADTSSLTPAIDARLRELGQTYVHFSATTFNIPGNGGSDTITVHTNSLEPLKRGGIPLSGYSVTETLGPNIYAYQQTTNYDTLSVGSVSQQITVTQAAGPAYLDITPTTVTSTAAGQSFNLQATYNTQTTPSFSPPPSWITQGMVSINQGTSSSRPWMAPSYTISPNLTADQRTATITVTSGDTSKTCTITQAAATLHYEPDTTLVDAPAAGGDIQITFQVNTATDNPTFDPDDGESAYFGGGAWLTHKNTTTTTADPDTGLRTVTITLTAESNLNGGIPREYTASFTLRNTTKTVTITQGNTES